ncbi:hypothetical protein AB0I53_01995 [Saccharopolyspora sp. NPDC050389]|uniref:hypothetical protein n=1 Tax=Saccharopolyspora sp. NPDC050389 TaxID=3155516 RepID=UPI0033C6709A
MRRFAAEGIGCSVLMAPILPGLSDAPEQIDATVRALAKAGVADLTPLLLHLRPGAREWFRAWLQREHPELVPSYARLYREGSYVPESYPREVLALVADAKRRHGIGSSRPSAFRDVGAGAARSAAEEERVRQLSRL